LCSNLNLHVLEFSFLLKILINRLSILIFFGYSVHCIVTIFSFSIKKSIYLIFLSVPEQRVPKENPNRTNKEES